MAYLRNGRDRLYVALQRVLAHESIFCFLTGCGRFQLFCDLLYLFLCLFDIRPGIRDLAELYHDRLSLPFIQNCIKIQDYFTITAFVLHIIFL